MTNAEDPHAPRPNMTSMIDVVFLLLIFFLANMKFRERPELIRAELPPVGLDPSPAPPLDKIRIATRIAAGRPGAPDRVLLQNRDLGAVADAATWKRLDVEVRELRDRARRALGPKADVVAELDAAPGVHSGHVFHAADVFLLAEIPLTFRGTPPPGR